MISTEELRKIGKEIDVAMDIVNNESWCGIFNEEKKKLHVAYHLGVIHGINKNVEHDAKFGFLYGKQYQQLETYVGFGNG